MNANKLSYTFHKLLSTQDYNTLKKTMDDNNVDKLISIRHNGLLTNIINFYIVTEDIKGLNYILSLIDDFPLMKRDYLHLIKFYISRNKEKAVKIFINHIVNNSNEFLQKDLDYLIDNKLYCLLPYLDGLYMEMTSNKYFLDIYDDKYIIDKLKYYIIENKTIRNIMSDIENVKINDKIVLSEQVIENINKKLDGYKSYNVIIDAANILHSRTGKITFESYNDLIKIINNAKKLGEVLVVCRDRDFKTFPLFSFGLKNMDITWISSPIGHDDLYILWIFLKLKTMPYIITNDNFKDHIFNFKQLDEKPNFCQFKNIVKQQSLKYNIKDNIIDKPLGYSKCIQYVPTENTVYIPYHNGNYFVKINI